MGVARVSVFRWRVSRECRATRSKRWCSAQPRRRASVFSRSRTEEPAAIAESVTALLALQYANLELVEINDGSPDALNVGLNLAMGDLVCVIDADTIVDADALPRLARPLLADAGTVATGRMIRVANRLRVSGRRVVETAAPTSALVGLQVSEYLRACLLGRLGGNRLGGTRIISGAFGLFKRESMMACGGYTHDTVGEDMELVIKLRRQAYEAGQSHRVVFVPDAVAWTEVPASLAVLGRQRDRWHRGLADVLWRHRDLIGNPRYGAMGMVGMPYFLIVVLLADELSFPRYRRTRDRLLVIGWSLLEPFGYRQVTVVWRVRGLWKLLRGRTDWGRMERRGFGGAKPATGESLRAG